VTVQGSWIAVGFSALLGATCFAGLSLLIAARTDSVEVASGWMNLVQIPMWLLSGTFFSYERFPEFLHSIIRALPLTAVNDLLRALVNDGAALHTQWAPLAVLCAWTVIAFAVTLRLFRWQ
jgi:ABC-type multidrug transport system permease subunit